jgi:hypothetical protein
MPHISACEEGQGISAHFFHPTLPFSLCFVVLVLLVRPNNASFSIM